MTKACILVCLYDKPAILRIDRIGMEVTIENDRFHRIEGDDFHGFYDWLRTPNGKIMGVRYFLFDDYEYIADKIKGLSYVCVDESTSGGRNILIFFGNDHNFDEELSCDQLFAGDYVFKSERGFFAFSFENSEDEELGNI